MPKLITDKTRDAIVAARAAGEKRIDTVRRLAVSEATYDAIILCKKLAESGQIDRLNALRLKNSSTVCWALSRFTKAPAPAETRPVIDEYPATSPQADGLTLEGCTKPELIAIVRKLVEICGPAAEATLELELLRAEVMRIRAMLKGGATDGKA